MSFPSYVKKEIARHNKEIEERELWESSNNFSCSSAHGEKVRCSSSKVSHEQEASSKSTLQTAPLTEEPPLVPHHDRPPIARKPSQGTVLVGNNQKIPFPITSSYQLPQPPNPPLLTPHSTPIPPPPNLVTHSDKKSNVEIKNTLPVTGIASNLPPRPPQRPPPPPTSQPPPLSPAFKPQQACIIPKKLPSVTNENKASTVTHQLNNCRLPIEDMHGPATRSVHRPYELQRPLQPPQTESPMTPMHNTPSIAKDEDSGSSFEEIGEDSDASFSSEEFEEEPGNAGARTVSSYHVSKPEERDETAQLQIETDDSDDDWGENGGDDDCNKIDSSDASEVQVRHKRDSHGLATKALSDAIDISIAMQYVSGFYNLPALEETHAASPVEEGIKKVLWKDLPVVKCNPIFKKMDVHKRKFHETIFEIMTTEALYISLLNSFEDQKSYFPTEEVLATSDREMLFSRLLLVKQCAESFYEELEGCWQKSIFLHGIFDTIEKHFNNNFSVYVKYCTNQGWINKMFNKAKLSSGQLSPQLKAFQSFLMLPMQRIARLPGLIESILQQMPDTHPEYPACKRALIAIRKKAAECIEDSQSSDRMGGLLELSTQFVFPDDMPPFPLISASRWLRKRTQATRRWRQDDVFKTPVEDVEMFLFNDVFFICSRKKRDDSYLVHSYCRQSLVEMTPVKAEFLPNLPQRYASDRPGKYVLVVDLLCNQNERREIMVLSMSSQQERDSWLEVAPPPPIPDKSCDICFESWDCPIVVAVLPFEAATPYQLSLAVNDKMHVTKRKTIGWYEGERLSDRKTGFFPVNYTLEIDSPHKKAREIRERFHPAD